MIFVKPTPTNGSPDDTNNGTVNNINNADNDDNDDAFPSLSIENVIQKKSTYSADEEERKKKAAEKEQQEKEAKYHKDLQALQDLLIQTESTVEKSASDEYGERD